MRMLFVISICALFLSACGGAGSNCEQTEAVSPEMQTIEKASDEIQTKSDKLNKEADSLLQAI